MMKTEYRFAEALKSLMSEESLDQITVTKLSKKCKVNRQTFYYHFHDIYDLLTLVFLEEKIPNIANVDSLDEMVRAIFAYYSKNKRFIDATIDSACKDLFQEFVYNSCNTTILKIININFSNAKMLHPIERKNVARFFALGYAYSICYYLSTYKNKTIEGLLSSLAFMDDNFLEKTIDKYVNVKSKKNKAR